MRLDGQLATEWDLYTSALNRAGVSLSINPDCLLWAGGDASGSWSVKNIYSAILQQQRLVDDGSWLRQIWHWVIPLKIKLFTWLAGSGKILTWDVLRRRGREGPGICPLCRSSSEDTQHLLIHCDFTKELWRRLYFFYSFTVPWSGSTLSDCFTYWISKKSAAPSLAAHACWQLWAERNKAIFESHIPSCAAVYYRILATFHWQPTSLKPVPLKACDVDLAGGHTLACFDGAAKANGLCCGSGGFFKSHPARITKWFLNCGEGTNTKAEFLGLWVTLLLASHWSINHLLVLGDSRVIIDWINLKSKLQSVHLAGWLDKTRDLSSIFSDIKFLHISRTHNREADALSKRALIKEIGTLSVYHCDNGIESSITSFSLF